jgi:hypothetical protein
MWLTAELVARYSVASLVLNVNRIEEREITSHAGAEGSGGNQFLKGQCESIRQTARTINVLRNPVRRYLSNEELTRGTSVKCELLRNDGKLLIDVGSDAIGAERRERGSG